MGYRMAKDKRSPFKAVVGTLDHLSRNPDYLFKHSEKFQRYEFRKGMVEKLGDFNDTGN